ncbi:helix-turn-helix transcriptional regulator [Dyadobacter sp. NIV53]|uniref:helix-turn-helix transcriptional regulator n=1 Tax=Dyadobacter sp. NIV53 TaxID=2861765 RepID=UPI001E29A122
MKNISPSLFADEIGIQRSSISHILAGRNKPSLDIVQKIVKRFPDLGLNWILDDENFEEQLTNVEASKSIERTTKNSIKANVPEALESDKRRNLLAEPAQQNLKQPNKSVKPAKMVERIVIFYSDGTFQEFKQDSPF